MHFCYGPDILRNAKDTRVNKAELVPAFMSLLSIGGKLQWIHKQTWKIIINYVKQMKE